MADNSARYDRDGSRRENISGVEFDVWLQGGLDNCCSLYAVLNAFSYLFALEQSRNPEGKVDKDGLLRREGWKNWSKIKRYGNRSKDLADQDLAKMYRNGAYPNYVVGLAKYINRVLFGERYYIGPHKRGLEALKTNDQNYLLHIVFVQQDKEDKLGHYISLINSADQMRSDYRCVLDFNRRYILWKLDGQRLCVQRFGESKGIPIYKAKMVISICSPACGVGA